MPDELVPYDGPSSLVALHAHTVYSTLDGVATPEQYFATCKERGYPAMAITEHGSLASMPDNFLAAKDNGIKYIPGCEIYFNDYEPLRREMHERGEKMGELKVTNPDLSERIRRNRHLTVLAKNAKGVENLTKLTTQAYETGFYYKPRIWFDKLVEYGEGLSILSGCLNGPVAHEIRKRRLRTEDKRGALDYVEKFKYHFGDDYRIELQQPCLIDLPGMPDHEVFTFLNAISNKYKIGKAIANDSHYLERRDFEVQKVMMAVDQGLTVDSPDLFHVNSSEQYFKTRHELWHTFKTNPYSKYVSDSDFHAMCDGTLEVAERCDNYKPDRSPKVPELLNANADLKRQIGLELRRRGLDKSKRVFVCDNRSVTYIEQARLELNRFIEKNFASYFLITANLIKYSIETLKCPVGPRGSVGGSLVCYLLGITSIDPLLWGLSFDRFLSPSRGGTMLNLKPE